MFSEQKGLETLKISLFTCTVAGFEVDDWDRPSGTLSQCMKALNVKREEMDWKQR